MTSRKGLYWLLILTLCLSAFHGAEAKRRRRRKHYLPPVTHPVILWSRTLSESTDREERKVAAFKLSQYSQTIYQEEVINSLIRCMRDPDNQLKVLCTKAMAHAGTQSQNDSVRKVLLEFYRNDPSLRNTIVRTFITRRDSTPIVHDTFLESARKSTEPEEELVLLGYFEAFGSGTDTFVTVLSEIYRKTENIKVKRSVIKALGERAHGQEPVVVLFSVCADNKDTPLALLCLSGLQLQARKDARAWVAVEKTIQSEDPDMLMATLDVINALPEAPNPRITQRLVLLAEDDEDSELQEKAVLGLGVCGDQSEAVVNALTKILENGESDESVRIAAALVIGRQAASLPDRPKAILSRCSTESKSQSFRTACQLGMQELEVRSKAVASKTPTPPLRPPQPTAPAAPVPAPTPSAAGPVVTTAPEPKGVATQKSATDRAVKSESDATAAAPTATPTPAAVPAPIASPAAETPDDSKDDE